MLMSFDALLPLLRCPRTGAQLRVSDEPGTDRRLITVDGGRSYEFAGTQPILVDFERSVLDATAPVAPLIVRGRTAIRDDDPHPVSRRNALRLVASLETTGSRPRVLVIGGGSVGSGSGPLYEDEGLDVVGLDVYPSEVTCLVADAHGLPFPDGAFDAVWIQAVLEHVLEPARVVDEIRRVLRPGGLVYAETPLMQQVHEGAYDFSRFTENGHRFLFRWFEVLDSGVVLGPGVALRWSLRHFLRALTRSEAIVRIAWIGTGWLATLDRWCDPGHASDGASALFLLGRLAEAPIGPRAVSSAYRGAQRPAASGSTQGL